MKKFIFWSFILAWMAVPSVHATWDVTTPAGSESKSLGDDRIRELKTDIQTSLQYEGDFPGSDTSNPRFLYTPSTGTTSLRPTSSTNTAVGMLYVNITSGTIEQYYGNNEWRVIATTVPLAGTINVTQISTEIAGAGLAGGGGDPLRVNVDSNSFTITNDTVTLITGGVTGTHILDNTISGSDVSTAFSWPGTFVANTQPAFFAYASAQTNVTGDGTTVNVTFGNEVYDKHSDFSTVTSSFTAPLTGTYLLNVDLSLNDTASGNRCEIHIITGNRTYSTETWPTSKVSIGLMAVADMDAGDLASVDLWCNGGTKVVDIVTSGGTTTGAGIPSFFSGTLLH